METVLITGANGEVGHGLIPRLAVSKKYSIIALDINDLDPDLVPLVSGFIKGSVLDKALVETIFEKHQIATVFHLAALLSTAAEKNPELAHLVNVDGTALLLEKTYLHAQEKDNGVKFFFPSTIAIYGLPGVEASKAAGAIKEDQFLQPITMYGINKLYCEHLGNYYSTGYKMLDPNTRKDRVDFRSLRFPGIISAVTIPTGGTSDYAPEMIHSAARGEHYESFVRPDTQIPFMVMPDAIKAILSFIEVPKESLSQRVYNISGFSDTADHLASLVKTSFPEIDITYKPDENRQKILDSWPDWIDDSKARQDWGWNPDYDLDKAFREYLIPQISQKYR